MAARGKPAGEGEGGSGEESGGESVTRAELDKFKDDIVKLLDDQGSKSRGGGGGGTQTGKAEEHDARRSVEEAFKELRAREEHDEHHRKLREAQEKAAERETERAKRTAPVETGKARNKFWDY